MSKIRWTDDLTALPCFKDFGVDFEVQTVSLVDIDEEASRQNHARIVGKPVDDELVEEYALAMENGDSFPRIVLFKNGRKYVTAGGNHRREAAKLKGLTEIEAYVLDTKDEIVRDLLPRALNRRGGRRTGKEEATEHAIYAISKYGYSNRQAASQFGISEKSLQRRVTINDVRRTLADLNVDTSKMADEQVRQLSTLSDNDNVLVAAARLFRGACLPVTQSNAVVAAIKAGRNENQRIAVVAEYERRLGVGTDKPEAAKTRRLIRMRFLRSLTGLESVMSKAQTLAKLQITDQEEKENVGQRLQALGSKFQRLTRGS